MSDQLKAESLEVKTFVSQSFIIATIHKSVHFTLIIGIKALTLCTT